jgi:hypothetical protein
MSTTAHAARPAGRLSPRSAHRRNDRYARRHPGATHYRPGMQGAASLLPLAGALAQPAAFLRRATYA